MVLLAHNTVTSVNARGKIKRCYGNLGLFTGRTKTSVFFFSSSVFFFFYYYIFYFPSFFTSTLNVLLLSSKDLNTIQLKRCVFSLIFLPILIWLQIRSTLEFPFTYHDGFVTFISGYIIRYLWHDMWIRKSPRVGVGFPDSPGGGGGERGLVGVGTLKWEQ